MKESKKYICPVCGLDKLTDRLYNDSDNPSYEICDCCGFEFGFDDVVNKETYDSYRKKWLEKGANWFRPELKPANWNVDKQLNNLDNSK